MAMVRRVTIQFRRFHQIPMDAVSVLVHVSHAVRGLKDSSACSLTEPLQCLRIILRRAFAIKIHDSQVLLRARLSLLCSEAKKSEGFSYISGNTIAQQVGYPQTISSSPQTLDCGLAI